MQEFDDIVVSFVPEAWSATRLVRGVGRARGLVAGIVIVGWCGTRELRLVRGRDVDRLARRLTPVVDLVVAAARRSTAGPADGHALTMTNVPDGHRMFDELGRGRKIVVAELVPSGSAAVQRWLHVLAATAERSVTSPGVVHLRPGAAPAGRDRGDADRTREACRSPSRTTQEDTPLSTTSLSSHLADAR